MLTKLIILGILNRRRHYGYEIKKTIEFEMRDFDIKFGSIYHALKSFQQQGLIRKVQTEQTPDGRPDRFIYEILEKGRLELHRLLLEAFQDKKVISQSIEAALHFLEVDSIGRIIPILKERIQWLQIQKRTLNEEKKCRPYLATIRAENPDLKTPNHLETEKLQSAIAITPLLVTNIMDHKIDLIITEINWMQRLLPRLEDFLSGQ